MDAARKEMKKRSILFFCGHCGKALQLRSRVNGRYFCRGRTQERENSCQKVNVKSTELEEAVLCQVRAMADMLVEERNARRKAGKDSREAVLETIVSDSAKETAQWKSTKMHLYEKYKAGKVSREDYMEQIERGRKRMEEMEKARDEARAELERIKAAGGEELPDDELAELSGLEEFDKDRLKVLIEKVMVYGEDAVEVVWKVRNPFKAEKPT